MRKNLHYAKCAFCALPLLVGTSANAGADPLADAGGNICELNYRGSATIFADIRASYEIDKWGSIVEMTVRGKVTDENGNSLPGVTVVIENSSQGTITDLNGEFTLEVPNENVTLLFSFVGYATQSILLNGRTTINVSLEPDVKALQEVVVVGYGSQKKADVTGAIATMDAKLIEERPITRVDQALVGQMAGVRVQQTSGVPGAGFKIQVRGSGSIGAGDQPLYVVDGFPLDVSSQNSGGGFSTGNPLDNLNPNDIESIQVLKDASSAAIYGSRGANGVVIITTKSGKTGKPRISYNSNYGWNETSKKLDVLTGEEWIERALESINYSWVNSGAGRTADQTPDERLAILQAEGRGFNRGLIPDERWLQDGYPGLQIVDWQDEIFRKGFVQNHQVSASGGKNAVRYFVSGDYLDQEGIAINVGFKRYSARANVDLEANEKLRFGININPSYSIASDPGVEGKDRQMHIAAGFQPVVEEETGLNVNVGKNTPYLWGVSRVSPVAVIQNNIGETEIIRALMSTYGEYEFIDGLTVKTTFNFDIADQSRKFFSPSIVNRNRVASGSFSGYRRSTFVNENTLSYNKVLNEVHNISALGGISYNFGSFGNFQISSADGFVTDDITTLNGANNINVGRTYTAETQHTMLSYFGRVQYNFSERYLFGVTLRRDGSSRFGKDTKWGTFPSASVGWRISEENFMQGVDPVSNLKFRASWGISGNNSIGNYSHIAMLNFANYTFGNRFASGMVPSNFPNPSLGWEQAESFNLGIDLGIFNNRIFTSFDYYTRVNNNLLLNIPVPTATGFTRALTNIGEVFNEGWDWEVTTHNTTGALKWQTNLNLSWNRNEVRQLGPDNTTIYGGAFDIQHNVLMVGEPMYSLYVVQQDGILTQKDIEEGAAVYGNQTEGDPKYVDADGDGVITPDDRVLSGHPNPDYIWGINNSFSWKGFDLNILLQGQWGGKIYSTFGRGQDRTGMSWVENTLGLHRDRWRSPEDPGAGLKGKAVSRFGRIKNTDWLYPNDYWRIRNITLGYDLTTLDFVKNGNLIQKARIYVTAENWFGGDKYTGGWNPEAVNTAGDDYGAFPLSKSLIFGLNVTF